MKCNCNRSLSIYFICWMCGGLIGAHRFYLKRHISVLLYYWLISLITLGIFTISDLVNAKKLMKVIE